jgi:RNA polymerase sigma factor (TIGR02999 family)
MSEVTRILSAIEQGGPHAAEQLLPLVYDELRLLAAHRLARENPGQTLQATALVHEAYLRLVGGEQAPHWNSRGHFFAPAAEAMRRILVEQARRKQADKHGGGRLRPDLPADLAAPECRTDDLVALDEALGRLGRHDAVAARLVKLRDFAGLSHQESAQALGTPAYMSPEQAAGRLEHLGPASDEYSLGAALYTLLTGRPPVEDKDTAEVLRKAQRGEWLPPRRVKADVPAALDEFCRKALAPQPERRYGTALELAAEVERWLADEPVTAYAEPWAVRSRRWTRRHRPLVSTAVGVTQRGRPPLAAIA